MLGTHGVFNDRTKTDTLSCCVEIKVCLPSGDDPRQDSEAFYLAGRRSFGSPIDPTADKLTS